MEINLVSAEYQTAYYQATGAAARTGDDVFEFTSNDGQGFATGQAIRKVLKMQQGFPLVEVIKIV